MRKRDALRLAYQLNTYLNLIGPGRIRALQPVKKTVRWLVGRMGAYEGLVQVQADGWPMYVRPEFAVDYLDKPYEPVTTELFKAALKPGAIVLDIGAHSGYYSIIAAWRIGRRGKVYAFEPGPDNFDVLKLNAARSGLGRIVPVQKAVSDQNGEVTLRMSRCTACHSLYHHPLTEAETTITVLSVTIDSFLKGRPVDVIKMDIEGSEPFALRGMRKTIARSPNLVLLAEFSPEFLRELGVEPEEFLGELEDLGFEVQLIDEERRSVMPVRKEHLLETYYSSVWPSNFYCVKRAS